MRYSRVKCLPSRLLFLVIEFHCSVHRSTHLLSAKRKATRMNFPNNVNIEWAIRYIYIGSHRVQTFRRTLQYAMRIEKYLTGQNHSSCLPFEQMAQWNRFDLYWCTRKSRVAIEWLSWTPRVCGAVYKVGIVLNTALKFIRFSRARLCAPALQRAMQQQLHNTHESMWHIFG